MLPAAALPVTVGVVTRVIASLADEPLSDAAARIGALGAFGAVVSTVIASAFDASLTLPAASVARAVSVCAPSASVLLAIVQWPAASAVALPRTLLPSLS